MNNNGDWGVAAAGLMLALLDKLEASEALTPEEGREIFQKAIETIEQLSIRAKQPDMMRGSELLNGIYEQAIKHIK